MRCSGRSWRRGRSLRVRSRSAEPPSSGARSCATHASLAGALTVVDDARGLPRLLELVALAPPGDESTEAGRTALSAAFAEYEQDWRGDAHERRRRRLALIRDWACAEPDAASAASAAYAAGLAIAVTFTAVSRTAEDAVKIRYSAWAIDNDPIHGQLVLAAAALLAAYVPRLEQSGLEVVLERLEEIAPIAAGGEAAAPVGRGARASGWGRAILQAAAAVIVLALLSRWRDLPLAIRRRVVALGEPHALLAEALKHDAELRRVLEVAPLRAGADASALSAIAHQEGVMEAAAVLATVASVPGSAAAAEPLAETLAASADAAQCREILLRYAHTCPPAAAAFLPTALQRHPSLLDLAIAFASRSDTAGATAAALDAVPADDEARLVAQLADAGFAGLAAEHLAGCARLTPQERATALIALASDGGSPDRARAVLAHFPAGIELADSAALELALRDVTAVAPELAAVAGALAPAALAAFLIGRLERVLRGEAQNVPFAAKIVQELPGERAEIVVETLGEWLIARLDDVSWPRIGELAVSWIKPADAPVARAQLLDRLSRGPAAHAAAAAQLLAGRFGEPIWLQILPRLLRADLSAADRAALQRGVREPAPSTGSGDEQLEQRAAELEAIVAGGDPLLAAFLRDAAADLRADAARRRADRLRHSRGYD